MTDLEFAQVSLPSENFLQYTVVSLEWNFLPESCDFEVQRRVHKLKKNNKLKNRGNSRNEKMIWGWKLLDASS